MRKRIFQIVETGQEDDRISNIYAVLMMGAIVASLVPLAFKSENDVFLWIDKVSMVLFIIDSSLRFITADYKLQKKKLS